jgi:hypothetical protein
MEKRRRLATFHVVLLVLGVEDGSSSMPYFLPGWIMPKAVIRFSLMFAFGFIIY